MNTYLAIFDGEAPLDEITKEFGEANTYAFADNAVAVKAGFPKTADIRQRMCPNDDHVMIVFRLNGTYSGHYYGDFWTWMDPD